MGSEKSFGAQGTANATWVFLGTVIAGQPRCCEDCRRGPHGRTVLGDLPNSRGGLATWTLSMPCKHV